MWRMSRIWRLSRALAELEEALADPQGFDHVLERGGGNSKLGGRPRGAGNTAPAFRQRGLDNLALGSRFALATGCLRLRRHAGACDGLLRRAQGPLFQFQHWCRRQYRRALDDVAELADIAGP